MIDQTAVSQLLRMLAGGMLTITTVTLSVLILVLSLAAGQASPRSLPELMADTVIQNALSTFLATFVFAVAALSLFGFGVVEPEGVAFIFAAALLLGAAAMKYLVQWIHHIANHLQLNLIAQRLYLQADASLEDYIRNRSDFQSSSSDNLVGGITVHPSKAGYVQFIDIDRLQDLAESLDLEVELTLREGDFAHPRQPVMVAAVQDDLSQKSLDGLKSCLVIGPKRTSEGDPLLGFELLAEIACRALSPSLNDPQTALLCVNYMGALLARAAEVPEALYARCCTQNGRVKLVPIGFADMLQRAVRPLVRDGAGSAEVICGLVDLLSVAARSASPEYVPFLLEEAHRARDYALEELSLDADKESMKKKVADLEQFAQTA